MSSTATKAKPKLKIQPLEDRVVILPSEEAETMRGGLYIPDTAKEKPTQGEVIAVGPGRVEKGERIPLEVAVGDKVIYGKYSGTHVHHRWRRSRSSSRPPTSSPRSAERRITHQEN